MLVEVCEIWIGNGDETMAEFFFVFLDGEDQMIGMTVGI